MKDFCYDLKLGQEITNNEVVINNEKPVISVITPFYNGGEYIEDAAKSLINQSFPYWEWIIIDDGSTKSESLEKLESIKEISQLKGKVKIVHKENEGPAAARDYGVNYTDENVKYLCFLDEDDLFTKEYLECAYWTLETNKEATWTYSGTVTFGAVNFLWRQWFDSEKMKRENLLPIACVVKKEDFLKVNGFELREKSIYEDWNLWLKFLQHEMIPIRMNFFGFWYRKKPGEGELVRARENHERAMQIVNETATKIKKEVRAIQYPRDDFNWDIIIEDIDTLVKPKYEKNAKKKILFIIPWMTMGGADKFNLDFMKGLDKDKFEIIVITTVPNQNLWRQEFENESKYLYDLTTFLDRKYWLAFINYIIEKENIDLVFNTNSLYGYSIIPYLKARYSNIPIIDYIHMEEWYYRNGGFSRECIGASPFVDKTYVCNKNSEDILVNHFGKKPEEVETVYIGVDEKKFDPIKYDKNVFIEKHKLNKKIENKKVIGFIARIDLQKRPYLLIEIINKLSKKRKDFVVVVAGDGPMLSKIKSKAKSYRIEQFVEFIGSVKETEEFYGICDMTLNCSIKEGLALTAYESLAMGVPVVSADVGGQRELIDKNTGVIVPCLQAEEDVHIFKYEDEEIDNYVQGIEKVLDNLDEYKSKCREKILQGFTIDHMKTKMNEILGNTIENPNKEKIENGKSLSNSKELAKELIVKELMIGKNDYKWLSEQLIFETFGSVTGIDKFNYLKERLWKNPFYRIMIKIMQKTGLMHILKKKELDKKIKNVINK